jgi:uncharacterized RDD family membrane protein YckC
MINQSLLDYIKQQIQQNTSQEQIKSSLLTNGWSATDIEEGFSAIGLTSQAVPLTPSPTPNTEPLTNAVNSTQTIAYAGFWLRVLASIIDGFIVNLIIALFSFLYLWFFVKNNDSFAGNTQAVVRIFYFIVWIIYCPFIESRGGATLGKKIIGLKVLNGNGEPVGFFRSLGRNLAKIISSLILMIGFMMAGFTKKKQGLHDFIAGCIVIKSKKINAGKIWAVIILIIGVSVGLVILTIAQLTLVISTLFNPKNINTIDVRSWQPTTSTESQSWNTTDTDLSNQTTQNEATETNNSTLNTFIPLSSEEYDTYFSQPIMGLDKKNYVSGSRTYAGPALIILSTPSFLRIALPIIPNLEENNDYAWIDLTSITTRNGKEILDNESPFEQEILFKGLNFTKDSEPIEFLSASRKLHYLADAQPSDVKTITGTLFFKIPLDSEDSTNFYEKSYPFSLSKQLQ